MTKLKNMRVIEIPHFKAVSSGYDTFDIIFADDGFDKWITEHPQYIKNLLYAAPDFMWHEDNKSIWIWAIEDWVTDEHTAPYDIVEFAGGIYLVATADENDNNDLNETVSEMVEWINASTVFESDDRYGHRGMCHMVGCGEIQTKLKIAQQEIFLPIKFKKE